MKKFLYYLPGQRSVDETICRGVGLVHSVAGCGFARGYVAHGGPDGGEGALCVARYPGETGAPDAQRIRYVPAEQTWSKCAGGKLWVGYWNDAKPGPADLARKEQRPGHAVRLGDDALWQVPVIYPYQGAIKLPQALGLDADGNVVAEDLPEYAELRQGADQTYAWVFGQAESMLYKDAMRTAALALSLNYCVGPWECSAARLFTTENVIDVCKAIIDVPLMVKLAAELSESEKKKNPAETSATSSSSCGSPDDCRDIDLGTLTTDSVVSAGEAKHG